MKKLTYTLIIIFATLNFSCKKSSENEPDYKGSDYTISIHMESKKDFYYAIGEFYDGDDLYIKEQIEKRNIYYKDFHHEEIRGKRLDDIVIKEAVKGSMLLVDVRASSSIDDEVTLLIKRGNTVIVNETANTILKNIIVD